MTGRWVSDDGEAEVVEDGPLTAIFADVRITLQGGPNVYRAYKFEDGRYDSAVVVKARSGELFVAHQKYRPAAKGTEADPRSVTREWTCARVLEGETTT
jgi:hypothetical protein